MIAPKLSLSFAALSLTGALASAQDTPNSSTQKNSSESSKLEVMQVVGKKDMLDVNMNEKTERLLSVAGAANDPLQAIYALPGVTFSNGGGPSGSEPVIRGSSPQDNGYFIDMVPASYIFHLFGNSIFDKNLIHNFELYPAAFPSDYGNATGGIIDVTLREPRNQEFTTTLHASFINSGAMIETGLTENSALYASYRRSMVDLFAKEEDAGEDEPGFDVDDLPASDDYQVKYRWDASEHHSFSLVAAGASDTVAATFSEGSNPVARDPDFAGPAEIKQSFDSQGAIWNFRNAGTELDTIFSHISDKRELSYGADQYQNTDTDSTLARVIWGQELNDTNTLRSGLRAGQSEIDIDINAKIVSCSDLDPDCPTVDADYVLYQDQLTINTYEVFLEDNWQINDQHSVTLGVHYGADDYIKAGRAEPRLRWDYAITDSVNTYLAGGQYSQLPELREMIDVIGNPNLTSVKADHYVWGINQELGDGWRWQSDIYYKDLTDVVLSDETLNYRNGAEGRAYGVEFLVNKDITEKWYGWVSLSLSKTDRSNIETGERVDFEYDKPVLFNVVMNYELTQNWLLGFKWNYQSGGLYTPVVGLAESNSNLDVLEPIYGDLNSQRLPDYHRLDFRAEYTSPKSWGYWKFYADILNLYNQENVEGYDYTPNGKDLVDTPPGYSDEVPVSEDTSLGIFPSIGFEIQF